MCLGLRTRLCVCESVRSITVCAFLWQLMVPEYVCFDGWQLKVPQGVTLIYGMILLAMSLSTSLGLPPSYASATVGSAIAGDSHSMLDILVCPDSENCLYTLAALVVAMQTIIVIQQFLSVAWEKLLGHIILSSEEGLQKRDPNQQQNPESRS